MSKDEFSWEPFLLNAHLAVFAGLIAGVVVEIARVAQDAIKLVSLTAGFTIVMLLISGISYYGIHILLDKDRHNGLAWTILIAFILISFAIFGALTAVAGSRFG